MGDTRLQHDVGLFMLGVTGAAGLFAMFNDGFYSMIQKGISSTPPSPEEISAANMAMNIGLGVTVVNGVAIGLLNGKDGTIPGIASIVTGAALYLFYNFLLSESMKPGVPAWAPSPTAPLNEELISSVMKII